MDDLDRRYVEWEKAQMLANRERMKIRKALAERALSQAIEQWEAHKDEPFAAVRLGKAIERINKAEVSELASSEAHDEIEKWVSENIDY